MPAANVAAAAASKNFLAVLFMLQTPVVRVFGCLSDRRPPTRIVVDTKRGCLPRSSLPSGDVDVDDVSSAAATTSPPRARSLSVSLATHSEPRRHVGEILDAPGRNGDKGPVPC